MNASLKYCSELKVVKVRGGWTSVRQTSKFRRQDWGKAKWKKWSSATVSCVCTSKSVWGTGKQPNHRGRTQLYYSYSAAQHIFWLCSKSRHFLNSVNLGVTGVVSRGSETAETPSSVITLTTATGVAVNSETPQKRCWHSLTRVGRNHFLGGKRKPRELHC